jgi:hypothetical protein
MNIYRRETQMIVLGANLVEKTPEKFIGYS